MATTNNTRDSKVVFVNGVSDEVGEAAALRLARDGFKLIIADAVQSNLQNIQNKLSGKGKCYVTAEFDATNLDSIISAVSDAVETMGSIDLLVNNTLRPFIQRPALEISVEDWDDTLQDSLTEYIMLSQVFAQYLLRHERTGRIINVSSVFGILGKNGFCLQGVLAASINQLTRSLAAELAEQGVFVNSILAGPIQSMYSEQPNKNDQITNKIPVGHLGAADDIAEAVSYLANLHSSFMTGQSIIIDGGMSAI